MFLHLLLRERVVKQLLSSLDKYLFLVHIIETDQDQLDLLEESASYDSLKRQDLLELSEVLLQSLFEKALGKRVLIDDAL